MSNNSLESFPASADEPDPTPINADVKVPDTVYEGFEKRPPTDKERVQNDQSKAALRDRHASKPEGWSTKKKVSTAIVAAVVVAGAVSTYSTVSAKNRILNAINEIPDAPPLATAPAIPGQSVQQPPVVPPVETAPVVAPPEQDKTSPSNVDVSLCPVNVAPGADYPPSVFCGSEFSTMPLEEQQAMVATAELSDADYDKLPLAEKVENAKRLLLVRESDALALANEALKSNGSFEHLSPLGTSVPVPEAQSEAHYKYDQERETRMMIIKYGFTVKQADGTYILDKREATRSLASVFVPGSALYNTWVEAIDRSTNIAMVDIAFINSTSDGMTHEGSTVIGGIKYNKYHTTLEKTKDFEGAPPTIPAGEYDTTVVPVKSSDGTTSWLIDDFTLKK